MTTRDEVAQLCRDTYEAAVAKGDLEGRIAALGLLVKMVGAGPMKPGPDVGSPNEVDAARKKLAK
jgi:hypothetical protein